MYLSFGILKIRVLIHEGQTLPGPNRAIFSSNLGPLNVCVIFIYINILFILKLQMFDEKARLSLHCIITFILFNPFKIEFLQPFFQAIGLSASGLNSLRWFKLLVAHSRAFSSTEVYVPRQLISPMHWRSSKLRRATKVWVLVPGPLYLNKAATIQACLAWPGQLI